LGISAAGQCSRAMDTVEHFFVMVGQLVDEAIIGGISLTVALAGGDVVEGVPTRPASPASGEDELDDTGYARRIQLAGVSIALADVRRATVVYPDREEPGSRAPHVT